MKTFSIFFAVLFASITSISSVLAECKKPTTILDLTKVGQDGEKAFAESNLVQLLILSRQAREVVIPCLAEKIVPRDASRFHRLMALEAFTDKDLTRVVAEFHAARKLDPGYEFPLDVVPEEHRLRTLYEKALLAEDGTSQIVYPPDGGHVTVGGVRGAPRPEKTPVIIQAFDLANQILETIYLRAGDKLPVWGKNPMGITAKDLGIDQKSAWVTPKTWYISAGVAAVITGALYGVAMYNKSQFQDTSSRDTADSDRKLQGYADRANAFGTATIVTGACTLAFAGLGAGFQVFAADEKPHNVEHKTGSHE